MKSKAITAQTTPPTGYTLFLAFTKDLSEKWGHAINGNSIWVSLPWSLQGDWTEASNRLRLLQNAATGSSEISKKSSIASMAPKAEMLLQSAIALKPAKARKRQFKRHPTTNQYVCVYYFVYCHLLTIIVGPGCTGWQGWFYIYVRPDTLMLRAYHSRVCEY